MGHPLTVALVKELKNQKDIATHAILDSSPDCSKNTLDRLISEVNTYDKILDLEVFLIDTEIGGDYL